MALWRTCIVFALALFAGLAGAAERPSTPDAAIFRKMAAAQIDAFRRDDAEAAYALASPVIQGLYPGPKRFMAMIRLGYAPLYRARSVAFGAMRETATGPELDVHVTDVDDRAWRAIYSFRQQPDGTWRINGCVLSEDQTRGI